MKYKIRFKNQNTGYGESHYVFSPIPRDAYSNCAKCKTFPYCVVLHNSGYRYKSCPCHQCMVQPICVKQCDNFKKEVHQLFGLKSTTDYKNYWYSMMEKPST